MLLFLQKLMSIFFTIYIIYEISQNTIIYAKFKSIMKIEIKQYSHDFIEMPSITICISYESIRKMTNYSQKINSETSFENLNNKIKILNIFKYDFLNKFFKCKFSYGIINKNFRTFDDNYCDS